MAVPAHKIPGPDHPIAVTPSLDRVAVKLAGETVAETTRALTLKEASYPAVEYIPRSDAKMAMLIPTTHRTHCPYKGDASYFSIKVGDRLVENAVWSYEHPYPAVKEIAGHLAFYPSKVDAIEVRKTSAG